MNRVRSCRGYTIVETMIFLGVSGALFISIMLMVGGQQGKAQFTQSIRDIDSKIQDIINDVATGYYNNSSTFECPSLAASGRPEIIAGSGNQGTNEQCIFVGRVIQFAEQNTDGSGYNTFTMVGRRHNAADKEVTALYEAQVVPIDGGGTLNSSVNPAVSATESNRLYNGLSVEKMYFGTNPTAAANQIGAVGFFSTFASYGGAGVGLASNSARTNLLPIAEAGSGLNRTRGEMIDDMVKFLNPPSPATLDPTQLNPDGGVTICFKSGTSDLYGIITVGSNEQQLTTNVEIVDSATAIASGGSCEP